MKKLFVLVLTVLLVFIACKKEEPLNLEAFSPQGFAFDLGDVWEVNATVRVKGFQQNRNDETKEFSATIFYKVDLEKPNGEVKEDVFNFVKEINNHERLLDVGLEAQFELSSEYEEGAYKLIYHIRDELSGMETNSVVEVELQQ
ncbi:MAG: hypothetical protein KGZ85_15100 [Ignavibacterium sp.]|nr:hypothetical protein [Ignavibacterium sp.]